MRVREENTAMFLLILRLSLIINNVMLGLAAGKRHLQGSLAGSITPWRQGWEGKDTDKDAPALHGRSFADEPGVAGRHPSNTDKPG